MYSIKIYLKDSIFIYQLELLLKIRKFIIYLIKSNKNFVLSLNERKLDDSLMERLNYFIETIKNIII